MQGHFEVIRTAIGMRWRKKTPSLLRKVDRLSLEGETADRVASRSVARGGLSGSDFSVSAACVAALTSTDYCRDAVLPIFFLSSPFVAS